MAATGLKEAHIYYQFYTSDFRTFAEKHPDYRGGYYWEVGDLKFFEKRTTYVVDKLSAKKIKYYQILRKYLLIKQLIPIPELLEIIISYCDFPRQLLTIVYRSSGGN